MHRLLYLLLLIYGLFLEPTPKTVSFGLIIFSMIYAIIALYSLSRLLQIPLILFICVLFISLILNTENIEIQQLFRDMISISYLLIIPQFFLRYKQRLLKNWFFLELSIMIAGSLLSLRYISDYSIMYMLSSNIVGDWRNLTSEPLVLASGLLSIDWFIKSNKLILKVLGALFFGICFMGLVAVSFRGPILIILTYLVVRLTLSYKSNILLYLIGFSVTVKFGYLFTSLFEKLIQKQERVGDNGKLQEIIDALYYWIENAFLFGQGLGTSINLGYYGSYTHNFFTYILLRFGLVGASLLAFVYILPLLKIQKKLFSSRNISLLLTLLYISLFQAAYKHIGFAIILGYLLINKNELSRNNLD